MSLTMQKKRVGGKILGSLQVFWQEPLRPAAPPALLDRPAPETMRGKNCRENFALGENRLDGLREEDLQEGYGT